MSKLISWVKRRVWAPTRVTQRSRAVFEFSGPAKTLFPGTVAWSNLILSQSDGEARQVVPMMRFLHNGISNATTATAM
jgi:hypothetical protein